MDELSSLVVDTDRESVDARDVVQPATCLLPTKVNNILVNTDLVNMLVSVSTRLPQQDGLVIELMVGTKS